MAALGALEAMDNMEAWSAFAVLGVNTVSDAITVSGAKAVPGGSAAAVGVMAAPDARNVLGVTAVVDATGPPVAASGLDARADATAVTDAVAVTDAMTLIGAALVLDEVTHLGGEAEFGVALASTQGPQLCTAAVPPYDLGTSAHLRRAFSDSTRVKTVTKAGASAARWARESSSFLGSDVPLAIFDGQPSQTREAGRRSTAPLVYYKLRLVWLHRSSLWALVHQHAVFENLLLA